MGNPGDPRYGIADGRTLNQQAVVFGGIFFTHPDSPQRALRGTRITVELLFRKPGEGTTEAEDALQKNRIKLKLTKIVRPD